MVQPLSDIRRLLFDRHENVARLVIETHLRGRVTDLLDTVSDDLLVVDLGFGGDLSEDCVGREEGGG